MRRLVVFLGIFSLLALVLVAGSAALVTLGPLRPAGHAWLAWFALLPLALYLVLSLRLILRGESGGEAPPAR